MKDLFVYVRGEYAAVNDAEFCLSVVLCFALHQELALAYAVRTQLYKISLE